MKALLEGLIDYAGLFPPAELALDEAAGNFRRYISRPERWILGRFILPCALVPTFEELSSEWDLKQSLSLSVLCGGGNDPAGFLDKLQGDLQLLRRTPAIQQGRLQADVIELKLPPLEGEKDLRFLLKSVSERLGNEFRPWYEFPWASARDYAWIAASLSSFNESFAGVRPAGFKLRCGGVKPEQFPAVEEVAAAIHACARAETPMKFTAGLHHPFRHMNEGLGARMHGFVNVFLASILARELGLESAELEQVLFCEDPADFVLEENSLGYRGWRVGIDRVRRLRRDFATSYGSCSFDEPLDDLREIDLLPGNGSAS